MAVVKSQPGMTAEQLLRQFNKKVQGEGILTELKEREFYRKPSLKRSLKKKEAQRRIRSASRRSE